MFQDTFQTEKKGFCGPAKLVAVNVKLSARALQVGTTTVKSSDLSRWDYDYDKSAVLIEYLVGSGGKKLPKHRYFNLKTGGNHTMGERLIESIDEATSGMPKRAPAPSQRVTAAAQQQQQEPAALAVVPAEPEETVSILFYF